MCEILLLLLVFILVVCQMPLSHLSTMILFLFIIVIPTTICLLAKDVGCYIHIICLLTKGVVTPEQWT